MGDVIDFCDKRREECEQEETKSPEDIATLLNLSKEISFDVSLKNYLTENNLYTIENGQIKYNYNLDWCYSDFAEFLKDRDRALYKLRIISNRGETVLFKEFPLLVGFEVNEVIEIVAHAFNYLINEFKTDRLIRIKAGLN